MSIPFFHLDVYSHHFRLTQVGGIGVQIVDEFAKRYIQYGLVKHQRRFVRAPVKIFAARVRDYEYRFHIEQLKPFMTLLGDKQVLPINYVVSVHDANLGESVEVDTLPQWTLRDYQVPIVEYLVSNTPTTRKLLEIQTGRGKGSVLSAKIKIPGGWTTMGEVKVGDTVTAWDGTPTKINGVFPQGEKDTYRVTFADGRSTVVDDTHLWEVSGDNQTRIVINTLELKFLLGVPSLGIGVRFVIPEAGQEEQEILLDQLLQSDKSLIAVQPNQSTDFHTGSEAVAKQVTDLVRSFGGVAMYWKTASFDNIVQYCVHFTRKPAGVLGVRSIEFVGRQETQCISVEHEDHLYVTDDFIVTHNTFCAMKAAAEIKQRILIVLKPMYMDKWSDDVRNICGLEGDEVLSVSGSASLMGLIAQAKSGVLDAKVIIVSNKTLQNWFSLYERKGRYISDDGYDCLPGEFCQTLGIGLRIIDEVHQDFHLNFKLDLYTHVARSISLSATLNPDDPFLREMTELAYPKANRYAGLAYHKYANATALMYQVRHSQKIKTMQRGSSNYSHHAFEDSVMKDQLLFANYTDMICKVAKRYYLEEYQPGDRCLIYCASIEMCTRVKDILVDVFPHLKVVRYVEEDPYEDLMTADVSVSTLLSAGTAVDIAKLTTVILTTAVRSSTSNIQGFGRLREIHGRTLRFVYFSCSDIPKHISYHEGKKEILKTRALRYSEINYPLVLG